MAAVRWPKRRLRLGPAESKAFSWVKLPHAQRATADPPKIRDYLLSEEHPVGQYKARFFLALGFTRGGWRILRDRIVESAAQGSVIAIESTPYGEKYVVQGTLKGPAGREADLVSVWIMRLNETAPRLVTAYPGGRR